MNFSKQFKAYSNAPITRHVLLEFLRDYKRPNDKISALIKEGELVSLRRGLYAIGPESDLPMTELFLIANHLRGPSYVSLESALSYWGFIPERTYEISSVTVKPRANYQTALGRFSYHHLSFPYYSFGMCRVELSSNQMALMATPEKAICDKIVLTAHVNLRSKKQTVAFLLEDLRMDKDILLTLNVDLIASWIENAPKKNSLKMLITTLKEL